MEPSFPLDEDQSYSRWLLSDDFNRSWITGRRRKVLVVPPVPRWGEMSRPHIAPRPSLLPLEHFVLPRVFRLRGHPDSPPPWARLRLGAVLETTAWRYTARLALQVRPIPLPLTDDDRELPLYAAYLLAEPAYTWTPQDAPLVQTATWETLVSHVVSAPWDLGYEYAQDAPQQPSHGHVMIQDVPRLIIRAITTVTLAPVYEYVLVQGVPEPAALVTQDPSARKKGGRSELHPSVIAAFQQELRSIVLDHYQKNKRRSLEEARIKENRVIEMMNISVQKWRLRLKRTKEDWKVNSWEKILDYIILSKA